MQVNTEDITVPWGQAPDSLDQQYGKWRLSVFQDVQESLDTSKLYFLYDPIADDTCYTTGGRKGMTCLVVFDTNRKCFVGEINLRVQGRVKFLFALKSPSPSGGTAFALVTQSEDYGQFVMHVWRVNMNYDGMSLMADPHSLLTAPIVIDSEFICTMREDEPQLVVVHGPGLNVVKINAEASAPQEPMDRFSVPGSELSHFYDGFVSRGNMYFLSSSPDGHFDHSRVHILNLSTRGPLSTQYMNADPSRGFPPPRKQAAIDSISGFILLAGGEIDYGEGGVVRLVDYWVLDLTTFKWNQVPAQMPVPLIEPRLTTANSGNVYLWGDFDEPLPGMPPSGTHVRILRIRGLNTTAPPPYAQATAYPLPNQQQYGGTPYPNAGGGHGWNPSQQGAGNAPPYPGASPYPTGSSPYPTGAAPYPAGSSSYPAGNTGSEGSYPHYPPQEKKEKDCTLM
ncbi:unnamed protein product [Meloidogyne enterolobii]|uniref:Uncharacterized protein n=2 Tax=Meloidogyne enterolobii TaxID=390850 RepID=A0ACB0ZQ96_MELEN